MSNVFSVKGVVPLGGVVKDVGTVPLVGVTTY